MLVAVVLGHRLNNKGGCSPTMLARLNLALELDAAFHPDKIILSGGVANPVAGKSEAQVMFDWLVAKGVDSNKLVVEDKSLTTQQNAKFSVPIAIELGADEVIICTTPEHMSRKLFNPIRLFESQLGDSGIKLSSCCCTEDLSKIR